MQVSPSLLPLSFSLDTLFLTPFVTHHSHLFNLLSPFIFSIPLISSPPPLSLAHGFPSYTSFHSSLADESRDQLEPLKWLRLAHSHWFSGRRRGAEVLGERAGDERSRGGRRGREGRRRGLIESMRRVELERRDRRMEREGLGWAPNLNDVIQSLPWQPEECLFKPSSLAKCRRGGVYPQLPEEYWRTSAERTAVFSQQQSPHVNFSWNKLSHANSKTFKVLSGLRELC